MAVSYIISGDSLTDELGRIGFYLEPYPWYGPVEFGRLDAHMLYFLVLGIAVRHCQCVLSTWSARLSSDSFVLCSSVWLLQSAVFLRLRNSFRSRRSHQYVGGAVDSRYSLIEFPY